MKVGELYLNGCITPLHNLWSMPSGLGFGPKRASEFAGGVFCNFWCVASVTRPRRSRGRIIRSFSLPRGRVSHATASYTFCLRCTVASVMRPRRCFFALGMRPHRPCDHVDASFSKTPFCAFLPFLYVSFPSFKSFLP